LDVKDESKEDGGVLIQYTSNGGYNQHWKFTDIGDGITRFPAATAENL